ncbi:MAG: YlxR family protein [Jatrophihabitans sp.]|nr:MAG: YlxR family protein [Jatrophihabitans sp.]
MAVRTSGVPVRTCIGCRRRAAAAELLRVVVAPDATRSAPGGALPVVPDPRHRASGRGAWLHRDPECVDLAQRRRAFARALRTSGPVDPTAVRDFVASHPAGSVGSVASVRPVSPVSSAHPPAEPRRS